MFFRSFFVFLCKYMRKGKQQIGRHCTNPNVTKAQTDSKGNEVKDVNTDMSEGKYFLRNRARLPHNL